MLIHEWRRKESRDESAMRLGSASHRVRLAHRSAAAELRIGWHDYSRAAGKVISQGHTLLKSEDGKLRIVITTQLPDSAWGFKAGALRKDGDRLNWPDKDFLVSLKFGVRDYADGIPRVCTASPQQKSANREA